MESNRQQGESSNHIVRKEIPPYSLKDIFKRYEKPKAVSTSDLQYEINILKDEFSNLKRDYNLQIALIKGDISQLKSKENGINNAASSSDEEIDEGNDFINEQFDQINIATTVQYKKWYSMITLKVHDFRITLRALIDSGADQICIQQGLIPTRLLEKTSHSLRGANGQKLLVNYKLSKVHICNKGVCFINTLFLVRDLEPELILGTPFLTQLYPMKVSQEGLSCVVSDREIMFEFTQPILPHEIDTINIIKRKQNLI